MRRILAVAPRTGHRITRASSHPRTAPQHPPERQSAARPQPVPRHRPVPETRTARHETALHPHPRRQPPPVPRDKPQPQPPRPRPVPLFRRGQPLRRQPPEPQQRQRERMKRPRIGRPAARRRARIARPARITGRGQRRAATGRTPRLVGAGAARNLHRTVLHAELAPLPEPGGSTRIGPLPGVDWGWLTALRRKRTHTACYEGNTPVSGNCQGRFRARSGSCPTVGASGNEGFPRGYGTR
jgi:hypothetical protein